MECTELALEPVGQYHLPSIYSLFTLVCTAQWAQHVLELAADITDQPENEQKNAKTTCNAVNCIAKLLHVQKVLSKFHGILILDGD